MAAAPALEKAPAHVGVNRPSTVAIGTIVWLSSELMFFSALFAMYFTIRSVTPVWPGAKLDVGYSAIFTTILVASSFTCQLGVFAAEKGDVYGLRRWFAVTFFMGGVFLLGQGNEFAHEIHKGLTLSSSGYGSVFYLTEGFHGLHVLGGLVAFIVVLARTGMGRFTRQKAQTAIVVSYYWHFVDIVWIGLFTVIYLIQ